VNKDFASEGFRSAMRSPNLGMFLPTAEGRDLIRLRDEGWTRGFGAPVGDPDPVRPLDPPHPAWCVCGHDGCPGTVAELVAERSSAVCPYCGQTFYGLPLTDPLKHHVDYCESRPEEHDWRDCGYRADFASEAEHDRDCPELDR